MAMEHLLANACGLSHVQLFFDPISYSPPGSSVHGISQTRILEWVAVSTPGDLPDPRIEPTSSALAGVFFTTTPHGRLCPFIS